MLKKMHDLSLSATIESQPALSTRVIEQTLSECVGGRTNDRELSDRLGSRFVFETGLLGHRVESKRSLLAGMVPVT